MPDMIVEVETLIMDKTMNLSTSCSGTGGACLYGCPAAMQVLTVTSGESSCSIQLLCITYNFWIWLLLLHSEWKDFKPCVHKQWQIWPRDVEGLMSSSLLFLTPALYFFILLSSSSLAIPCFLLLMEVATSTGLELSQPPPLDDPCSQVLTSSLSLAIWVK